MAVAAHLAAVAEVAVGVVGKSLAHEHSQLIQLGACLLFLASCPQTSDQGQLAKKASSP